MCGLPSRRAFRDREGLHIDVSGDQADQSTPLACHNKSAPNEAAGSRSPGPVRLHKLATRTTQTICCS